MIKESFKCCGLKMKKLLELRSILEEVRSVDPYEHVTKYDEEDASPNEL